MSVTAVASGTQTAVISTEHALYNPSPAVAGVFQLVVDLANLADGDTLELRAKQMTLTGGTTRGVYLGTFANAQPTDALIAVSLPISNELTDNGAVQFSLKQTTGTGRSFTWKVIRVA